MKKIGRSSPEKTERRPSLVEDAYTALKEAIRDGVFPPGYQGSEQEIALRLCMSRTPVHEAIIRLQEDGLVRVLPKRGVVVCPLAPEDMREIYDVIIAIEAMAAELLAMLPDEERRAVSAELENATLQMEEALEHDDLLAWAKADDRFHRTLVERCGNSRIRRIAQTIMDQSHRARMLTLKLRPKPINAVGEHRLVTQAICGGNALAAHSHARQHRLGARDELIPLILHYGFQHL